MNSLPDAQLLRCSAVVPSPAATANDERRHQGPLRGGFNELTPSDASRWAELAPEALGIELKS